MSYGLRECGCYDGPMLKIPMRISIRCLEHRDTPAVRDHAIALLREDGSPRFVDEADRLRAKEMAGGV